MIPEEVIQRGMVVVCHSAKELYWLFCQFEKEYPDLLWFSGDQPTKWFPRNYTAGISFIINDGELRMICWEDYYQEDIDHSLWTKQVLELVSAGLIPRNNPSR
jgi:hypothetical protein